MKRIALSIFLTTVILVSVCGVAAADENLKGSDEGRSALSLPTHLPFSIGHGSHGNGRVSPTGKIPTALLINVPKTTVYVGETLTVNARLINVNTGYGIPGAIVRGFFSQDGINWVEPGTLTTDSSGEYSYTGTVPDYPGIYYGYISYDGDAMYQGCQGSHYSVTVLEQSTPVPTPISVPSSSPTPTPVGSNPSATVPASSGPVPSPSSKSMPVPAANTTTKVSTNSTSPSKSASPSSSKSSPGFDAVYGLIALAAVILLKTRKKLMP